MLRKIKIQFLSFTIIMAMLFGVMHGSELPILRGGSAYYWPIPEGKADALLNYSKQCMAQRTRFEERRYQQALKTSRACEIAKAQREKEELWRLNLPHVLEKQYQEAQKERERHLSAKDVLQKMLQYAENDLKLRIEYEIKKLNERIEELNETIDLYKKSLSGDDVNIST